MASFAERMGRRAPRTISQRDDLDKETRNELWNTFVVFKEALSSIDNYSNYQDTAHEKITDAVWAWEFKEAQDEKHNNAQVWMRIKSEMYEANAYDVLDLIEEIGKYMGRYETSYTGAIDKTYRDAFNDRFEHFLVGYRFIGEEITPVDSTVEAEAVIGAIADADSIAGARHSLERATELLADRETPDYPNSIKESILAVEAVVKKVTGKGELSKGLAELEKAGLTIHPALKSAWVKMYGWASDEKGVRHASIEAADADQALAKYVLVTCSAFVSYLVEEGRKAQLLQ